jgi:hypothetical protein
MKVTTKNGKDVSDLYFRQMKGEITRAQFIELAGLDPAEEEKHYQERLAQNKNIQYV